MSRRTSVEFKVRSNTHLTLLPSNAYESDESPTPSSFVYGVSLVTHPICMMPLVCNCTSYANADALVSEATPTPTSARKEENEEVDNTVSPVTVHSPRSTINACVLPRSSSVSSTRKEVEEDATSSSCSSPHSTSLILTRFSSSSASRSCTSSLPWLVSSSAKTRAPATTSRLRSV